MKKNILILLFIMIELNALDVIRLNFFIEPNYQIKNHLQIASHIFSHTAEDSIRYYNFFCGQILDQNHSDKELTDFLNGIDCDYATPIDYQFSPTNESFNFSIIASHISSDNANLIPYEIIKTDSIQIGLLAIYSPDTFISRKLDQAANYSYYFKKEIQTIASQLQKKCDYVILLSNFSKNIDLDLASDLAIDTIISFDYQSKKSEPNLKPTWFSSKANKGFLGSLTIRYEKGSIQTEWQATKFND